MVDSATRTEMAHIQSINALATVHRTAPGASVGSRGPRQIVLEKAPMRVLVAATFTPIRSGIEARSPLLRMVGHGSDSDSAADSLAKAVRAWCVGLIARGELEPVLRESGVRWEPGEGAVTVDVLRG